MIATERRARQRVGTTRIKNVLVTLLIISVMLFGGYVAVAPLVDPNSTVLSRMDQALTQARGETANRPAPVRWLTVDAPTQTYWLDDSKAWIAEPGERYDVLQEENGWVFVHYQGDPPDTVVWMNREPWVRITD